MKTQGQYSFKFDIYDMKNIQVTLLYVLTVNWLLKSFDIYREISSFHLIKYAIIKKVYETLQKVQFSERRFGVKNSQCLICKKPI